MNLLECRPLHKTLSSKKDRYEGWWSNDYAWYFRKEDKGWVTYFLNASPFNNPVAEKHDLDQHFKTLTKAVQKANLANEMGIIEDARLDYQERTRKSWR